MSDDVRVVYRKFDGGLHWHLTTLWLGEDEHGRWVGCRPGALTQKGADPAVRIPQAHVGLFPHEAWWSAWFNAEPERVEIYCDVSTPAQWSGRDEVTMVDLDLDVCRLRQTGEVVLLDEDEFALHQVHYGYPIDVIDQTEAAARWLQVALGDGREPFASEYQTWLAKVL